jgi:hypothetical protein
MSNNVDRVALLDEEEATEFFEYATQESTIKEKEELKEDLEFYLKHCRKNKE